MKEESAPTKVLDKSDKKAQYKALRAQKLADKKKAAQEQRKAEKAVESAHDQTDDDDLIERALGNGNDAKDSREKALERLQSRITAMRKDRMGKKTAQEYEEQKRIKRSMRKMKRKEKKAENKEQAKELKRPTPDSSKDGQPKAKKMKQENGGKCKAAQPVATTEDGNLVFSKFDFIVKEDKKAESKKDKRDKFQGKDYKRLLQKAEKRKERIDEIREKNPDKAEKIETDIRWNNAISRAEGVKVKDDIALLKKSVKRKEKVKERKKQKWDQRGQHVKADEEKKQAKREANLQKRKDTVKKAKVDKLRKKGRIA
ncbi:hypothetical protein L596_025532 [Steinernema carpocapsae]|uniref:Ribosomal RNA-processing protein 14/surfeit locus protein 6 C-terminal domain-containing protein n=1 Tax=Steinernema carpocapsae TaxID=34508 RepID=A0A4U5M817_STECR|nr:hypothetical protein L596_025532 [Steinernema carpocapsae]